MAESDDPEDGDPGNGPGREYLPPWGIVALGSVLVGAALVFMGALWHYWPACESPSCAAVAATPSRQVQPVAAASPPAPVAGAPLAGLKILAADPPVGLASGRATVRLSGSGFRDGATVSLGVNTIQPNPPIQPESMTIVAPPHVAGIVDVTVRQTDSTGTKVSDSLPHGFTYVDAPTVSSVQPASGSTQGCDTVTLIGRGFADGMRVTFGGVSARSVVVNGPTSLTAAAPPHARGKIDLGLLTGGELTLVPGAFTYVCPLPSDTELYIMVLLAGALGGTLHAMRSFSVYVGSRKLVASWVPMYLLLPLTGATLALLFFVVIGAGLFSLAGAQPGYGMIGFAALVGMFSKQAVTKLTDVAEGLFAKAPKGSEHLTDPPLALTSVIPNHSTNGIAGSEMVTLVGTGFGPGLTASFGMNASPSVTVVSDTRAIATTPAAGAAGPVNVTVQRSNKPATTLQGAYTY